MFDSLTDAVEYGRRLVSNGTASKKHPAVICHTGWKEYKETGDDSHLTYYVVPDGWTWPENAHIDLLMPESDL